MFTEDSFSHREERRQLSQTDNSRVKLLTPSSLVFNGECLIQMWFISQGLMCFRLTSQCAPLWNTEEVGPNRWLKSSGTTLQRNQCSAPGIPVSPHRVLQKESDISGPVWLPFTGNRTMLLSATMWWSQRGLHQSCGHAVGIFCLQNSELNQLFLCK